MAGFGFPEVLVILAALVFVFLPFYRIFAKAGYAGMLCLTMIVPILNIIMLLFLAFSEWPILKKLKALEQRLDQ